MGGPFEQWAHQYDVPPRTQSGEGGMVAQSNKCPGSICGLRPIFVLFSHQYDVPPRTQSGEGGMVAQSNKYPGNICGLRPIFVLFSHLFPMWGQQTDRPGHSLLSCHAFLPFFNQETRDSFLSYWFSPFQPRCGFAAYSLGQYSLPSFPYSTQT